jgi:hypothetical protein
MNYDFNIGGGLNSRMHDASSHEDPTVSPSRLTWLAGCSTKPPGQNSGCSLIPQEPGNQNSSRNPRFSHRTFQKSGLHPHLDSGLRFSQYLTRPVKPSSSPGHSTGRKGVASLSFDVFLRPTLNSTLDPLQLFRLASAEFSSQVSL